MPPRRRGKPCRTLTPLVDVFLELTKGFAMPAGTVLLISSASQMAAVGTAEYAAAFVRARVRVGKTFTNGVRVLHGYPLLLGGTGNTRAIRTMAEIDQWVRLTAQVNHDITATRTLWGKMIRTVEHGTDAKPFSYKIFSGLARNVGTVKKNIPSSQTPQLLDLPGNHHQIH